MKILSMVATDEDLTTEPIGNFDTVVVEINGEKFKIQGHPFCFVGNTDQQAIERAEKAGEEFLKTS